MEQPIDKQKLYDFTATRTARCKILVVGDVMLDKYYYGEVTRISPEAPVPITHVTGSKETLGGAANVAHNLALLGCQTSIAGFVGEDYHCQSLMDKFTARGIDYKGLITTDRPTTTKMRIMGGHQQMLRLDFEDAHDVSGPYADRLRNYVNQKLNESLDCLVLSDYGKGTLTEETSQLLIKAAHAHGVPVVIDPKGMNWTKYAHADYITPNLKEINQVLLEPIANEDTAVERAAHYVMRKYKLANIVATRSEEGLSFVNDQQSIHIPTKAQEVFDVSGAGDTCVSTVILALAAGTSPARAAELSNIASGIAVRKLGTATVSAQELRARL